MVSQKSENYKWVIFVVCILMVFVCLGFCSSNKGLYLAAITDALGIGRSLFAINDSCRFVTTAVINLFFGTLVQKYGVRKMTAFGFVALIVSMLTYAFANHILLFYLGGILLGVGLSFTTTTMASSIVRRWFHKDIGKYTGIVFAANGIGGAVAAQIVSPLINEEGNLFGYRNAYFLVACILLVVGITVAVLLKEKPENTTLQSEKVSIKKGHTSTWFGINFETAKRRPYFYVGAVLVLLTGFMLQGISGAYAAHMKDVGLDAGYIATMLSIASLMLTVSKVVVGFIYDRFGLRTIMIMCQGAATLAFLSMVFLNTSASGRVLAFLFVVCYALALPLETLVIPLIVNELFGGASYDKILGIYCAMNYAGYALGAPVVNLCFDLFGTYRPILLVFAIIMIPVCILFQFGIKASEKMKKESGNDV